MNAIVGIGGGYGTSRTHLLVAPVSVHNTTRMAKTVCPNQGWRVIAKIPAPAAQRVSCSDCCTIARRLNLDLPERVIV